jgi:hypothetical protein
MPSVPSDIALNQHSLTQITLILLRSANTRCSAISALHSDSISNLLIDSHHTQFSSTSSPRSVLLVNRCPFWQSYEHWVISPSRLRLTICWYATPVDDGIYYSLGSIFRPLIYHKSATDAPHLALLPGTSSYTRGPGTAG